MGGKISLNCKALVPWLKDLGEISTSDLLCNNYTPAQNGSISASDKNLKIKSKLKSFPLKLLIFAQNLTSIEYNYGLKQDVIRIRVSKSCNII